MKNNDGVLVGSFDPFTRGHYDIVSRAARLFTNLYLGVADDTGDKKCVCDASTRAKIVSVACRDLPNVHVQPFNGLLTDFCGKVGAYTVVRGLRTFADFEYERSLSAVYKSQCKEIESVFLLSDPSCAHISGTFVRSLC
ncbi:MAG: pantetheine-phosphate adenylyltransferase, partial [Clostridiales bacterium]|nr:pantetheine-phosphate adenylyltransferase [Clostridiales bacterium]